MLKKYLLAFILTVFSLTAFASAPTTANNEEIQKTMQSWADALSSGDPQKIVNLYDKNAFLYATFKNVLDTPEEKLAYFKGLMQHPNLKVTFKTKNIRTYHQIAISSGLYNFSYDNQGKKRTVPARYTFVYSHEPTGWLIVEHHSSVLPE